MAISSEKRQRVVSMFLSGSTEREISSAVGVSTGSVHNIIKQYRAGQLSGEDSDDLAEAYTEIYNRFIERIPNEKKVVKFRVTADDMIRVRDLLRIALFLKARGVDVFFNVMLVIAANTATRNRIGADAWKRSPDYPLYCGEVRELMAINRWFTTGDPAMWERIQDELEQEGIEPFYDADMYGYAGSFGEWDFDGSDS